MTAFARQNAVVGVEASVKTSTLGSATSSRHGSCCCHHRGTGQPDMRLDHHPGSSSRRVYDRTNISIITTSTSSFLQQAPTRGRKVCQCRCRSSLAPRRRWPREKGIKMKRLVLLLVIFVLYVSLGAVVFNALEAGAEQNRKDELQVFVEQFLEQYDCVNRTDLYKLLKKAVVDSEIVNYVVDNKTHLDRWDFSGAFGFVVSVVTTIGFGNMSPVTLEGKVVCVVYALFGIPLTLVVLASLGEKMASCVSRIRKCQNPMCHHTPRVNHLLNVLYIGMLGVAAIFLAPAAMFTYVEQWYFMEALYFCFTTLSTIGFGDYVIGIHETRLTNLYTHEFYEVLAYVWILVGLAYLSLVYRYITDTMVAKAQEVGRSTIRRLGPEFSKSWNVASSDSSPGSSRCCTPERRVSRQQDSILTENTELICQIDYTSQEADSSTQVGS